MPASDQLSETKACDLLARLFRSRGFDIARNIPFAEYGVSFHIDGWDSKARVGFEFLSSEDDDHDDLSLKEYQTLMAAQLRGELSLFVIDEVEPLAAADLRTAAEEFLDELAAAAAARRIRRKPAANRVKKKAKAAVEPAAKRSGKAAASRKPVATKAPQPKKRGSKKSASAKKAVATRRTSGRAR